MEVVEIVPVVTEQEPSVLATDAEPPIQVPTPSVAPPEPLPAEMPDELAPQSNDVPPPADAPPATPLREKFDVRI